MISAFLIVRNEATNLPDCLATLGFADEIVVVDSGSDDGTIEAARRFTDRVLERPFTNFADQKNYALSEVCGEWAFSIDADERVPPSLRAEILATVAADPPASGYRVPRRNYFRGQWIRFSYPDYQTRLFRSRAARFVGVVHEAVEIDGPVGTLENALDHHNAPSIASFWKKIRRYAAVDARQRVENGEAFPRRSLWTRPLAELRRMLIGRRAWQDGVNGILLAGLLAMYAGAVSLHGMRETRRRF